MGKNIHILTFFGLSLIGSVLFTGSAHAAEFTRSLGYGMYNSLEVTMFQEFLMSEGYLDIPVPTGNFLSLTESAVRALQADYGIEETGYFGPITRGAVNEKLKSATPARQEPRAAITGAAITPITGLAAAFAGSERVISWQTNSYPAGVGVAINLLKKISASPVAYSLIRQIAAYAPNNGYYAWRPAPGETGNDLYIEIVCPSAGTFIGGCVAGQPLRTL